MWALATSDDVTDSIPSPSSTLMRLQTPPTLRHSLQLHQHLFLATTGKWLRQSGHNLQWHSTSMFFSISTTHSSSAAPATARRLLLWRPQKTQKTSSSETNCHISALGRHSYFKLGRLRHPIKGHVVASSSEPSKRRNTLSTCNTSHAYTSVKDSNSQTTLPIPSKIVK